MNLNQRLESLVASTPGLWRLDACGVTRSETAIPALLHSDAYASTSDKRKVSLVGGMSGLPEDVELALKALESYAAGDGRLTSALILSAVPCGNPDGLSLGVAPENGAGGVPATGYPPIQKFYGDPHNPEARYLWRWACFEAPDLVLEVRAGDEISWAYSGAPAPRLISGLNASALKQDDSLLAALAVGTPGGLAPIPGLRLTCPSSTLNAELGKLWAGLTGASALGSSSARRSLDSRRSRTPLDVARVLASVYGYKLDPVIYTQGVSISGRLRLARLDPKGQDPVPDVTQLVAPLVSEIAEVFEREPGGADLAALAWADELAEATGDDRYADLIVSAANRYQSLGEGKAPPPSDPDFRTEDMFFSAAVLGRAFAITGERRYLDMLVRFLLDAAAEHVQRDDGLFWHCNSAPYYWGRGNGFAALGYAETLTYLPDDHPQRDALISIHLKHLDALRRIQRPSGMWLQVLDFPGSYQEMSATCMIGYAMAKGLSLGWLDASYRDSLELAWQGVAERIDDAGGLVDVCTGTGVQESLRDYLDREAIFGLDDRGGAMALWFATEMARLSRDR